MEEGIMNSASPQDSTDAAKMQEMQLAIESGAMAEPEEDLTWREDGAETATTAQVDEALKGVMTPENYNLLQLYLTPEFVDVVDELLGLKQIDPTLTAYLDERTQTNMVLVPMDRSKLAEQMKVQDAMNAKNPSPQNSQPNAPVQGAEVGVASSDNPVTA